MLKHKTDAVMRRASVLCLSLALVMPVIIAAPAQAQEAMMFVDTAKVFAESKAGKDIGRQIEAERDKVRKSAERLGRQIEKERDELVKQQDVLSKEGFDKKRQALEQKLRKFQEDIRAEEEKIQKAAGDAVTVMQAVLDRILQEMLERKKLDIIMSQQAVLKVRPDKDLTSEILTQIDRRLPTVQVNFTEEDTAKPKPRSGRRRR